MIAAVAAAGVIPDRKVSEPQGREDWFPPGSSASDAGDSFVRLSLSSPYMRELYSRAGAGRHGGPAQVSEVG